MAEAVELLIGGTRPLEMARPAVWHLRWYGGLSPDRVIFSRGHLAL